MSQTCQKQTTARPQLGAAHSHGGRARFKIQDERPNILIFVMPNWPKRLRRPLTVAEATTPIASFNKIRLNRMSVEDFKTLAEGIQHITVAVAVFVGGLRGFFHFWVSQELKKARRERQPRAPSKARPAGAPSTSTTDRKTHFIPPLHD